MDFELTEELKMLKDMAGKFAVAELTPVSQECDEHETYTPEIRKKAAMNGLVGAWIPEEYGGAGAGILGNSIITEELSKVDMAIGLNIVAATFGSESIFQYGTEEQKQTYLPPICAGDKVCAGAFTEPNAGTDVAGYRTRAVKDGTDYVINGNKIFITNGTVCDFMVAQCITNPEAKKHASFSLIIIPADAAGVTRNKIKGKLGLRASDTAEIALEDVRVSQGNLVGQEGRGFVELMHFFDTTRVMVAAQGLGLSEACLETSVKYVKERTAFGAPLGSFQMTQKKLTEMAIMIEALRGLVYKSAWLIDVGRPDYHLAAMAKFFSGQTAVFCANSAVELHGGYGYIEDFPAERFLRDAKLCEIGEGTSEIQRLLIARQLGL